MTDHKPKNSPAEDNAKNKPTNREVREEFYRNIDIKLTFLKELKGIIDSASINDDPTITSARLDEQYQKIHEHFSAIPAAKVFDELVEHEIRLDIIKIKEKELGLLGKTLSEEEDEATFELPFEIAQLKKNPDVAFWVNIRDIIANLKSKNSFVKELHDDPEKFRKEVARFYSEYASIEFEKVEILYSAFGITFIVPAAGITEKYQSLEGFHLPHTAFSFAKTDPQKPEAHNDTVQHEEMHNILDHMDYDLTRFPQKFQSNLMNFANYTAIRNTFLARQEYHACMESLNHLQNEFLADISWIQHDITSKKTGLLDHLFRGKPSTASSQIQDAMNLIETGIQKVKDQNVQDALRMLKKDMWARFERIHSEMRRSIEFAEEMTLSGHPEASQEAYLLFFLFPPLEYRRTSQFLRHKYPE